MKLAFVHDWFRANGGAEKVAGEILDTYKAEQVTVYALFNKFSKRDRDEILGDLEVKTSMMQYVPFVSKIYRYFFPVMPYLIGSFKLKGYDLIISTSHAVAKGIGVDPRILNICYCHSPMRYAWDMYDDYVEQHKVGSKFFYEWFIGKMRQWDLDTAKRVHYFIANSEHVARRIKNCYGRDAKVIYPPMRTDVFALSTMPRKNYYLCMGRLVPYKKTDLIVKAFKRMPDRELIVIGEGYGTKHFEDLLHDAPNIKWLGYQPDEEVVKYMQGAKACVFAAKEDFGILCVEAQSCGTPVVALNYGGYSETVVDKRTGYLFDDQTEESIIEAVDKMEQQPISDHKAIREHAMKFSSERFRSELRAFVDKCKNEFNPNNARQ